MRQIWTTLLSVRLCCLRPSLPAPGAQCRGPCTRVAGAPAPSPLLKLCTAEHTLRPGHGHVPAAGELGCLDRLATRNPGEVTGSQASSAPQKGQGSPRAQRSFPSRGVCVLVATVLSSSPRRLSQIQTRGTSGAVPKQVGRPPLMEECCPQEGLAGKRPSTGTHNPEAQWWPCRGLGRVSPDPPVRTVSPPSVTLHLPHCYLSG